MMNEQVCEMSAAGIEFGSHTVTHSRLSDCSLEQAKEELVQSKYTIENLLGKEVVSLAYPYGSVNSRIKSIAIETGYSFGVATDSGPLTFYEDFFEIRRTQVFPWTDKFGFWKKTHSWYWKYKSKNS